jgi:hypothetical protein
MRQEGPWERAKLAAVSNRTRESRPSGIIGRLAETLAMEKAKRAQKAETLKQPSLHLRSSAPHFYPDRLFSHEKALLMEKNGARRSASVVNTGI